jgi:hypothetical protein
MFLEILRRTRIDAIRCVIGSLLIGLVGCGSGNLPCSVSGTVTFNSKPIAKGAIRFATEDGTAGNGGLGPIVDGAYSINAKGMMAGKYLVLISGFEETGRKHKPEGNGPEISEERQYVPAKFNASSTLTVELNGGANLEDFNLTR